jgi:hypothetical protein
MICLQAAQALLEHLDGEGCIPAVRADLGHEEGLVAETFQTLAEPIFRFAAIIFPATVEEIDTRFDRTMDYFDGSLFAIGGAKVVPTKSEGGEFDFGFTETA